MWAVPKRSQEDPDFSGSMDRRTLIAFLEKYESAYGEERDYRPRFLSLLRNFEHCYSRQLETGHITASAFIVDECADAVLLVNHRKLGRWLQPGGHADGEENLVLVATGEAREETGLERLSLILHQPFDIDIHPIPSAENLKTHFHYDLRFLFTAGRSDNLNPNHESTALAWIARKQLAEVTGGNTSILRMMEKAASLNTDRSQFNTARQPS